MLRIREDDYAYASARIRVRETKLLGKSHFDRMLDASTADEAYKVLTEAEYGIPGKNTAGVFAYEELLADEMMKCYMLLLEIAPQPDLVKAFQRRHDFFNIKVVLKAEFSQKEMPAILMDTGTIDKEAVVSMIRERDYSEFTPIMQEAIEQTRELFSKTHDPQIVDIILDKASYHQLVIDLNEIKSPFLHRLAELITDTTNIKMFIRARFLNKSWDFIQKILLKHGTIREKVYFRSSGKSIDDFVEQLHNSEYADVVEKGWEMSKSTKTSLELEKLLDDYIMEYIQGAKMVTMGVEPLIAYLFAKEAEIKNVRIIMTAKINKLSVDLIRERLRECYV